MSQPLPRLPYTWAKTHGACIDAVQRRLILRSDIGRSALGEAQRFAGALLPLDFLEPAAFEANLARAYADGHGSAESAQDLADTLGQSEDFVALLSDAKLAVDLLEAQDEAPIIRMINAMLVQALRAGASDIHFEPYDERSIIRFRVDGMLHDVVTPPRAVHMALASRIKVMADLDIAEKRLPQDGRIALRIAGRQVDVRVSTLPTGHGERVVLRLLDKEGGRFDLATLGMSAGISAQVDAAIRQPHGLFLVTGPTGSGKTTTLYAALQRIDRARLNVLTVEDPIEYDLPGVGQTQVNPKIDLDFARALRAILRQDPDVVLVGEIRDAETAQIAIQASLTGHLVLATLHTNDAVSAVTRLEDMGIEPFLISSSLLGVLSQRLVRRLCPSCRKPSPLAAQLADQLGEGFATAHRDQTLYEAEGCAECRFTGYRGRTGVHEYLSVDTAIRQAIHEKASEAELGRLAMNTGMHSLREDGWRWLVAGDTSAQELLRVTRN